MASDILEPLVQLVKGLPRTTKVSTGGVAKDLPPMPGLVVMGELIPLPVTKVFAEILARSATQSPFGKGFDTVVDTSVRSSLELQPAQFSFQNPDWTIKINVASKKSFANFSLPRAGVSLSSSGGNLRTSDASEC